MASALTAFGKSVDADVLIGLDAPDDAAVYAFDAERALVTTVDFFTPVVDDPYTFGAIAAANALSDIYAMGGQPLFALNIVAFPVGLDNAILLEILKGGRDKAAEAGVTVIGGHSIDDKEPKYGMAVTGEVHPGRVYRKGAARAGDRLVLSKAIGTGIISTAIKQGLAPAAAVAAAEFSMLRLNKTGLAVARGFNVGGVTDVSGYGLLGHLSDLAKLSGLAARLDSSSVPQLARALELARAGCVPGGTQRNLEHLLPLIDWHGTPSGAEKLLLCDAQTSGGLLISVAPGDADALVDLLRKEGHAAAEIGDLWSGSPGRVEVR